MAKLTWTGTKASARKMEDDINEVDDSWGKIRSRGSYATVEVEVGQSFYRDERQDKWAVVDTLSNTLTIVPGDSIEKVDGLWVKAEATDA